MCRFFLMAMIHISTKMTSANHPSPIKVIILNVGKSAGATKRLKGNSNVPLPANAKGRSSMWSAPKKSKYFGERGAERTFKNCIGANITSNYIVNLYTCEKILIIGSGFSSLSAAGYQSNKSGLLAWVLLSACSSRQASTLGVLPEVSISGTFWPL